jgi:hypothetical protein
VIKNAIAIIIGLSLLASTVSAQSNVVTFTQQDLAGLMASACGPQGVPAKDVHLHRNAAGNMLYIVAEGLFEALIYPQQQMCNPLAKETLNLWRNASDGAVISQLVKRYDGERLLMQGSTDGINGQHFDISSGGQYFVVSHGDVSSVSPVDRPYMRTVELQMDARRIFQREGGLLVVGSNKTTNRLEAVPVTLQSGTAVAGAPIAVPGVPAGVMILDYNPKTDELLLGGPGANSGVTSFAVANLTTGQARLVENPKAGAETALFISDPALYSKLSGQPAPVGMGTTAPGPVAPTASPAPAKKRGLNPFGWFGRN